jgi:hypothetical protein
MALTRQQHDIKTLCVRTIRISVSLFVIGRGGPMCPPNSMCPPLRKTVSCILHPCHAITIQRNPLDQDRVVKEVGYKMHGAGISPVKLFAAIFLCFLYMFQTAQPLTE